MSGLSGDQSDVTKQPSPELPAEGSTSVRRRASADRESPDAQVVNGDPPSTHSSVIAFDGAPVQPNDATVISNKPPSAPHVPMASVATAELGIMLEGERLGHFELEQFIGGGGMGAVFRGIDTSLGRTVAIKILSRQYAADEETTRRFQNEAQSAARLDHENIARVYFVGEDRGWHYIVLEFVDGENLRDLVNRSGPLSLPDFMMYALQIADALDHASSRDVVHRDIKPSNVLVTGDGRAKLVDMGLARLHQVEHSHDDLTASGVTLGTFDYISPEQARDPRSADVRSDLYSLGCTFYFMLTGKPPFPEGTVLQKLLQHQGDEAPDPRLLRPDLPEPVCRIMRKLLAKNPKDRYQEPSDLVADLVAVAEELQLHRRGPRDQLLAGFGSPTWYQRHLPWCVPTALLLLITLFVHYSSLGEATPRPPLPKLPNAPAPEASSGAARSTAALDADAARVSPARDDTAPGTPAAPSNGRKEPRSDALPRHSTNNDARGSSGPPKDGAAASPAAAADPFVTSPGAVKTPDGGAAPEAVARGVTDPPPLPPSPLDIVPAPVKTAFVVDGKGEMENSFATVGDAIRAAMSTAGADVATIELRFNGRLPTAERPMTLRNKLTIRAAAGFHPVVHFRPEFDDPALAPHSMITISRGGLNLSNVHLELDLTGNVSSGDWTLVECAAAKQVKLMNCWLTIRNAAADLSARLRDVSFFRVDSPRSSNGTITGETADSLSTRIELENCVARGEAAFLRGNGLESVEFSWRNGLLATSEHFIEVYSRSSTSIPTGQELNVQLYHVTANVRSGLVYMDLRQDHPVMTRAKINCSDCILITVDAPLIEQRGPKSTAELQSYLTWSAAQNFYENFSVFWATDSFQDSPMKMDWTAWQERWGDQERPDRPLAVRWSSQPPAGLALSSHTRSDYQLLNDKSNPAHGAAFDMSDAGAKFDAIPQFSLSTIVPREPSEADDATTRGPTDTP